MPSDSRSTSNRPIRVGVAGLGRMGMIHALHIHELGQESDLCRLTCVSSVDKQAGEAFAAMTGSSAPVFAGIDAMAESGLCDATIIATNTPLHREHTLAMIERGQRVFLEKPLTGTLAGDRAFAELLEREHPRALMLGFQRRFDGPLQYAKRLIDEGAIGRVFKIYMALEDSVPAPDGFASPGIMADMAVHNVDEAVWFAGRRPQHAQAIGSRIFSHRLTTCNEDFDDALMLLDFGDELIAQIQVTRNHVAGFRDETVVYGERGMIRLGSFNQNQTNVTVEVLGAGKARQPIARKSFEMRRYAQPLPEFIDRYGAAYKEELRCYLECCREGRAFPMTHLDGLRAQEIVTAAKKSSAGKESAGAIEYSAL